MDQNNSQFERALARKRQRNQTLAEAGAGPPAPARQHRAIARPTFASAYQNATVAPTSPVVGYASARRPGQAGTEDLKEQAEVIARECKRRGLALLELVGEREPANGKALGRPGLAYALERISAGEAEGLVVAELSRLTHSAAELGTIVELLARSNARFVAAAHGLDTEHDDGRLAVDVLVEVSRWERARLSERTRNGLQAARRSGRSTGRPAVADDPSLSERIAQMRAQGMTLQAIADQLNQDGVPTVRGGTQWRHSSVQAATGYRRRQRPLPGMQLDEYQSAREQG